jgi:hypothetical protein
MNKVFAAALGAVLCLSAVSPVEALPNTAAPAFARSTDVQQAKVVVRLGYLNGHRGYRARRPGYRLHAGYWYPPGAFVVVKPRRAMGWCGPLHHRHRCWR